MNSELISQMSSLNSYIEKKERLKNEFQQKSSDLKNLNRPVQKKRSEYISKYYNDNLKEKEPKSEEKLVDLNIDNVIAYLFGILIPLIIIVWNYTNDVIDDHPVLITISAAILTGCFVCLFDEFVLRPERNERIKDTNKEIEEKNRKIEEENQQLFNDLSVNFMEIFGEEYQKDTDKYNHDLEVYNSTKSSIETALEKIQNEQKSIQDDINRKMRELGISFKSEGDVQALYEIIELGRADSVKEALNILYADRSSKEKNRIMIARYEELDRKEEDKKAGIAQCSDCRYRFSCTSKVYNKGNCDNYWREY